MRMIVSPSASLAVAVALSAASFAGALPNGGLEETDASGWAKGWMHYGPSPWRLETTGAHSGTNCLFFDATDRSVPPYGRCAGMRRYLDFPNPTRDPLYFGAWAKSEDAYASRNFTCCLSIGYDDDTWVWSLPGQDIQFSAGTHGWELGHSVVFPKKPVKKIVFYAFIRKGYGKAWFDDLFLERRDPGPIHFGYRRVTDRPCADSEKLLVVIPDRELSWTSEATGGIKGSGRGRKKIEVPVSRGKCDVRLSLSDGVRTNSYDIALEASTLRRPYVEPNDVCVWTADSLRRVTPLTWPDGDALASPCAEMDMARGGAASAQILLTAGVNAPRKSVVVSLGTLMKGDGTVFRGTFRWNRVGYIERQYDAVPHPFGVNSEERYTPEILLPPAKFCLRAASTQGVWLTAEAARDAAPGDYSATVELVTSGGEKYPVPVRVTVHPFALPRTFGMETSFANMAPFTRKFFPQDERRIDRAIQDMMLDHRLNADDMSRWVPPDIEDVRHAISRGANRFNVLALMMPPAGKNAQFGLWPDPKTVASPEFMDHLESVLTPYVERLRKEGLMKYAYLYGFDERNQEHYAGIDATWRRLKVLYPDLPVMTTARMYKDMALSEKGTNFPNAITTDWYCPITSVWKPELTRQLQSMGKKVWWYTCCGPLYPHANFASIEEPWMDARVLAWQQYMAGADGLLFWAVNWWRSVRRIDPDETIQKGETLTSNLGVQGDGVLVYPGQSEVYPSIRLTALRDAVQDYEWLQLAAARRSRAACEKIGRSFIRALDDFDHDPDALLRARRQIRDLLVK